MPHFRSVLNPTFRVYPSPGPVLVALLAACRRELFDCRLRRIIHLDT
jgi:hypothetical protein